MSKIITAVPKHRKARRHPVLATVCASAVQSESSSGDNGTSSHGSARRSLCLDTRVSNSATLVQPSHQLASNADDCAMHLPPEPARMHSCHTPTNFGTTSTASFTEMPSTAVLTSLKSACLPTCVIVSCSADSDDLDSSLRQSPINAISKLMPPKTASTNTYNVDNCVMHSSPQPSSTVRATPKASLTHPAPQALPRHHQQL